MIANLKPYSEYKESGSKWLGVVPAKWEVRNLRSLISKRAERNRADLPLLSVAREKGVFVRSLTDVDENHNVIPDDLSNYKVARAGNLVINKMKAWQGSMGIAPCDGIVSPAYYVFDFRIANHAFGQRLLRSKPYVAHFGQASDGVRVGQWDLSIPGMREIPVLVPSPEEQTAIVRFLDWANGRLERAILAKRKVIALLNEQKQAIIHRAVTRGLDPSAPLKPSGIPWLGDIPQHWEVRRLKSLCRFVTSGSRGWARYYADDGFVFLRIGNISTTSIDLRLKHISYVTPPTGAEGERTRARPNDLLLSITAQIGAVGVVSDGLGEAYVNQHTALIRLRPERSVPRWVAYGLLSQFGKDQCRLKTNGGTKVGLTLDDVRCLYVLLPPMDDQVRLVAGIETETRALHSAISRLEREIELLREYRTRLVADVVTGKLDVQEAAARLPEESDDLESLVEGAEEIEETALDAASEEAET
ncbi:MAG: restriction endonuclease subunit S [Nitrospira sp.]|nr:restriction endonuclease subunit S [Nitrospira sp.]